MQAKQEAERAAWEAQTAAATGKYTLTGPSIGYNPYVSGQYQSDPYGAAGVPDLGGITTIPTPLLGNHPLYSLGKHQHKLQTFRGENDIDEIQFATAVTRAIEKKEQQIQEMMTNGEVKNWEHYRNLTGHIEALNYIREEIRTILKNQGITDA